MHRGAIMISSHAVVAFVAASLLAVGCGGSSSSSGYGDGGSATDGTLSDGRSHSDSPILTSKDSGPMRGAPMCDAQCPHGLTCVEGSCQPPQPTCTGDSQCEYDSYCSKGQCVPYGSSGTKNDPSCTLTIPPGVFAPAVLCQFPVADGGVPASDPFPGYVDVQATPIVVNFNQESGTDGGVSGPPSIVVPFTVPVAGSYTETAGVIRVLKGTDCTVEANLGNGATLAADGDAGVNLRGAGVPDPMRSSTAVAVGDLDGDGVAEVVAYTGDLSIVAFTRKGGVWGPLWATVHATTDGTTRFTAAVLGGESWSGPSIQDLDDDGAPEIIVEGYVLDGQTGVLKAPLPTDYALYYYAGSTTSFGSPPVVADLDSNGKVELLTGSNSWVYDPTTKTWLDDPKYPLTSPTPAGWTAVADFSPYDGLHEPEIAVASNGTISVFNRDHSVFMGMSAIAVPGGGGGPPTIADFDGDGLPEVGLAAKDFYTVFDPDCQGTPRPGGKCATATTLACDTAVAVTVNGVATTTLGPPMACPTFELWSKKTQDHSSDITGSSVFDFQGTGTAQVVYADECFARVYSGTNGAVQFSQYHSSCTWLENPVVADVDGDFHADLVVMSNTACGPVGVGIDCGGAIDANGVDTTFVGEICQADQDCVSGSCNMGYCRCTTSADCCAAMVDATCVEQGLMCAPPPTGTPGTGNTCRAPHPHGVQGIRVYKDAKNRWVPSRAIWNQHAYSVTNVNENGTVPKTSTWSANWTTKGLDNFRENVPGNPDVKAAPDLTAQAGPNFACNGGSAVFAAPVCNRGTAPVGAGVVVGFYSGSADGGMKLCSATTTTALQVGQCEAVSCAWASPPTSAASAVNVTVVANDGNGTPVCDDKNNVGLVESVYCGIGPK
jgi:hypothetical protein